MYSQINSPVSESVQAQSQAQAESTQTEAPSQSAASSKASSNQAQVTPSGQDTASEVYAVSAYVGQPDDWRLLLANRNNIVKNYAPKVKQFDRRYCQNDVKYYFDERAFDDAMNMINAALDDGIKLIILSSYRTYERQQTLYNNKVNYYLNKGYSASSAKTHAATVVAVPGTSDHNLGLAIDFNYLEQKDENSKELKWLRANAERFGFVMRYPKGKENVTGVIYEPWHYRYVGTENAERMNELNMCLEEYAEYLSKNT